MLESGKEIFKEKYEEVLVLINIFEKVMEFVCTYAPSFLACFIVH